MPVLNANNFEVSPVSRAIEVIRLQFANAQGLKYKLNQSCRIGADSLLQDALQAKLSPDMCPFVRLTYADKSHTLASNAAVSLKTLVKASAFFVYYLGKTGGTVLPVDFTSLRDSHIRANIEQLKNKNVKPNDSIGIPAESYKDDAGMTFWWWPDGEQEVPQEDESPFDVLGTKVPIPPESGFACSRIDFQIMVKNHATFLMLNRLITSETPSGMTDGTNPVFTLANAITADSNGNPAVMSLALNGVNQIIGESFTATVGGNTITFQAGFIPQVNDEIRITYYAQ